MVKIRRMSIDDYDEVYSLWRNTPGMGLNTLDDSRGGIQQFLNRNPNTCFVAEEAGRIIGGIMSGQDGRRGFIYHTAVLTDFRRHGIGSQLVEAALCALEQEGIHKVALVVFKRNEMGNAFWERMGFTTRGDLEYRNKSLVEFTRIDT